MVKPVAVMQNFLDLPKNRKHAYVALATGLILSLIAFYYATIISHEKEKIRFETMSDQAFMLIEKRMELYTQILLSAVSFSRNTPEMSREKWKDFYDTLNVMKNYPGIQALDYTLLTPKEKKEAQTAKMRSENFHNYKIHPESKREFSAPIVYIEPFNAANQNAHGYDIMAEESRYQILMRIAESTDIGITGKVHLAQENEHTKHVGIVMYVPFYKPGTERDKRNLESLMGFIAAPFKMTDLMRGVFGDSFNLDFSIYSGKEANPENLLFSSKGEGESAKNFARTRQLKIGEGIWTLHFSPQQRFVDENKENGDIFVLFFGLACSFFLFYLASFLTKTKEKAQILAEKMTRELKTTEERLRFAIEGSRDCIWDRDFRSNRIFFSKRYSEILGYEDRRNMEVDFSEWQKTIHPDDLAATLKRIQDHIDNKTDVYIDDHREVRKDGSFAWISTRGIVTERDANGKVLRMSGANTDITEQKKMQAALQAERDYSARIFHEAPIFIRGINAEGICLFMNPAGEEVTGYKENELQGKNWFEMLYPGVNRRYAENFLTLIADNDVLRDFEAEMIVKDGSSRTISWCFFTSYDSLGKPVENIGFGYDFTSKREVEKNLRKSEENLRRAQEIAKMGSWEFDRKSSTFLCSDEIFNIYGLEKSSCTLMLDDFLEKIHEKDRPIMLENFHSSLEKIQKNTCEYRVDITDGALKWVRNITETVMEDDRIFVRGIVQDISEQVRIARELEKSNTALQIKSKLLEELSLSDGLTQIPNRRYFDEIYEEEFNISRNIRKTLAVVMIDVDHFKAYNDFYGHLKGDECLVKIAQALKNRLKRSGDIIARYGGEEFVVLLKEVSLDGAKKVAKDLIDVINNLNIEHEASPVAKNVTISLGIAFSQNNYLCDKKDLFAQADAALYEAKANGRNQFVISKG